MSIQTYAQDVNSQMIETEKEVIANTESILDVKSDSVKEAIANPFSISQHRRNYFLPFTYATNPNAVTVDGLDSSNVDNFEAKYQVSMKLPLYIEKGTTSGLYMGFTLKSFWQVYNSEVSKPFRETNYEPEVYYSWQNELSILGFKFNNIQAGINHQSNGQTNVLSRSWNRLFASALFSDDTSFYYIKTWYRIPEDEKETPTSATGDDNPDITRYLGNIELGFGTTWGKTNISALVRNNLRTSNNKGSIELNLTYPLTTNYDLLFQYFNGYGDSLIDYNRHQQRVGLGVQLKFL
ncbi:phospholipase A [Paraglaciecola sp. 2405UD69-4]